MIQHNVDFHIDHVTHVPIEGKAGRLYRSAMPFAAFDRKRIVADEILKSDIQHAVVLVPSYEISLRCETNLFGWYEKNDISVIHFPIANYGVSDKEALHHVIADVIELLNKGDNVVVHCFAGIGRAGTFIACLLKQVLQLEGDEAVKRTRAIIDGAVESQAQLEFVRDY